MHYFICSDSCKYYICVVSSKSIRSRYHSFAAIPSVSSTRIGTKSQHEYYRYPLPCAAVRTFNRQGQSNQLQNNRSIYYICSLPAFLSSFFYFILRFGICKKFCTPFLKCVISAIINSSQESFSERNNKQNSFVFINRDRFTYENNI